MPKAYVIARVTVTDPQAYAEYAKDATEAIRKYGGRPLARGGTYEALEGEARRRNIVLEFPSYQQALACWHDPDYQAVKRLRDGHCIADILVIEGYGGPQPS